MPDFSNVSVAPPPNVLENLTELVERIRDLNTDLKAAQDHVEQITSTLNRLVLVDVPEAAAAAGITEFKLTDGAILKIKDDLKVNITQDNASTAYAWLRANGHGGAVKQQLEVDLRGLPEAAVLALETTMQTTGAEHHVKESIHAATLKSLVKEMLERGISPPPSISVYQFKKAEVKEPKK